MYKLYLDLMSESFDFGCVILAFPSGQVLDNDGPYFACIDAYSISSGLSYRVKYRDSLDKYYGGKDV